MVLRRIERTFIEIVLVADLVTLLGSFLLAYWLRQYVNLTSYPLPPLSTYFWVLLIIIPTFVAWLTIFGLYRSACLQNPIRLMGSVVKACLLAFLTVLSLLYMIRYPDLSRFVVDSFAVMAMAAVTAERLAVRELLNQTATQRRKRGRWRVLLVSEPEDTEAYLSLLRANPHWGIEVVESVSPAQRLTLGSVAAGGRGSERVIRHSFGWRTMLDTHVIDEVVAVSKWSNTGQLEDLQEACAERGLIFRMLVTMPYPKVGRYNVDDVGGGRYLVSLETVPQDIGPLAVKRAIDIIVSVFGLLACALVYIWYARHLRRESPGSVFFSQKRTGRNGRPFQCHKFRTMVVDAERQQNELALRSKLGAAFCKLEADPRITPTGLWLRRHHLDELPQFWNILRGEMSLVGPRPSPIIEATYYSDRQRRRLSMKPGLTGLFQIVGHGEVEDFQEVVELDCAYIDNWSLWLDLKIIFRTVLKVWRANGL